MKIIREIYSEWGTLVAKNVIEGTTLNKLSKKYGAKIEVNGRSFVIDQGGQTVIYKKK